MPTGWPTIVMCVGLCSPLAPLRIGASLLPSASTTLRFIATFTSLDHWKEPRVTLSVCIATSRPRLRTLPVFFVTVAEAR